MEDEYLIEKPADFTELITDILAATRSENTLVLALEGDLGAGKTTFTQVLAKHFGVIESVTSPTFTIMRSYNLEHDRFKILAHIDAYRFESEAEAGPLGIDKVLEQPQTVVCLEWPERVRSLVPATAYWLTFTINPDESRTVTVKLPAEK